MKEKSTIALVDDERNILTSLRLALEAEGYKVLVANDGDVGLQTAIDSKPDIILLDIIMPKMDGLSMLRMLRENNWGKTAKVIIITNLSNPLSETQAKEMKVDDYIIKTDWSLADIILKIKKIS